MIDPDYAKRVLERETPQEFKFDISEAMEEAES
jgi:hypothetical protein